MARLKSGQRFIDERVLRRLTLDLLIGPTRPDGVNPTDELLRDAWCLRRDQLMAAGGTSLPVMRPWAYWRFELGEDFPDRCGVDEIDTQAVRLADLGLLTPDELAALEEAANEARLRVGTDRERISGGWREHGISMDVAAVELWDRVSAAMASE